VLLTEDTEQQENSSGGPVMWFFCNFHLRYQVTPYVILFIERDGSTLLTSLLKSHPEIQAIYERFAVLKQQGADASEQLEWARSLFTLPLISRYSAVGFKTKLVDVEDLDGFTLLLQEKKCHVIHMERRNSVKAVVSKINARRLFEMTGKWNLYSETDRLPALDIDPAEFDLLLEEREGANQTLESYVKGLNLPTLKVVYEDLQIDQQAELKRIMAFLKVKPYPVKAKTLKNTKDNLREAVANFDELRARYVGTSFMAQFDEVVA
jgi:LPS sulfotransferase NodH